MSAVHEKLSRKVCPLGKTPAGTAVRYGRTVADSARSGKTGTGKDLGTRRDFHAAIWDPARDVLNVMAVCSAVAMYAVDEGNATSAGKDSFMVKDTTMDVK